MNHLTLKKKKQTARFKKAALNKVRELGLDGAIQHYLKEYRYYKKNNKYELSWLHVSINGMILEYLVNEIGE